jgi:RHS repeat-associated protein
VLSGNSYKWDGANRVVRFANSANNTGSSFTYDGLGRLVRVVDTHAGAITADHSYTWCGSVRCLAHDNTQSGSPVSTQYFDQGAIIGGTAYYYVKDQLGSVTHLVTNTGTVASQYSYDPYGNRTTISGTLASDIGYAGYFYHAVSGLDFTLYRAYDPAHARWLNRDPIGETGGINLYAYVGGNSTSYIDPSGLCPKECLNNFNNSVVGNVANFFSFASPLIGPDPWGSTIEDVGGTTLKYLVYQGLKSVNAPQLQIVGAIEWPAALLVELLAKDAAYAIETVAKDFVLPVALVSTIIQTGAHVYCDFQ